MNNADIAEKFQEMAVLLALAGENPFRIRAYERAAQAVSGLPKPLSETPQEDILAIPGIGKGIASHIAELLRKGSISDLDALTRRFPKGLLDMTKVPGLGPKRARALFDELGIRSLEALRSAAREGKLRSLAGFGQKLEASILKGLEHVQEASRRINLWKGRLAMEELLKALRTAPGIKEIVPAGSLRRARETLGDLDILCTARDGARVVEFFTKLPEVERVMAAGETKATVWLKAQVQCDLRVVPPESFGAGLLYFTGSKDHNVALRELAQRRGLTINEYGLFRASDKLQKRPLAGRTEEEIYAKLGLAYIPPELRENRGEIEAARRKTLPKLVELSDIRGDFHNHSSHTDGANSLLEMAQAARDMGWEWAALGDHSRSLRVAKGLSIPELRRTVSELKSVQARVPGIRLMRSMEVDVLKDGAMDYPDAALAEIDVVIASVHSAFAQSEEEMTSRIRRAIANPHVDIMGHLSGRLIGRREPYRVETEAVLKEGAARKTAFEINGQPERQDLDDLRARQAKDLGVKLAVTTDAHSTAQLRFMELAVLIARRAWLTKCDILNCLGYAELRDWLDRRRSAANSV